MNNKRFPFNQIIGIKLFIIIFLRIRNILFLMNLEKILPTGENNRSFFKTLIRSLNSKITFNSSSISVQKIAYNLWRKYCK